MNTRQADDEEFGEAMNKWTLKSLAAAMVGVLTFAGQAHAARTYSYVTDAGPNGTIDLQPGATRTLKLYLLETLTGTTESSSLIDTDGGLFVGGVKITRTAGTSVNFGTLTGANGTADFDGPSTVTSGGTAANPNIGIQQGVDTGANNGPITGNGGAANALPNRVFLGTLDLLAPAGSSGQSKFLLSAFDPTRSGNTFTFNSQFDFDTDSTDVGSAFLGSRNAANQLNETLTVNVVPEPTSVGVVMILGAAGSMIRRRRQA